MSDVDFFVGQINRLKSALGLSKDKEVAEALGLSDKALNARKARRSFPEREVVELAKTHPELQIDVNYVLTGKRSQAHVMAKLSTAGERVRQVRGVRSIHEFALALGVAPGYLEQVETAGQWLSNELLTSLVDKECVSPMWLLSGELPVLEGDLSPVEIALIDNYRHGSPQAQVELRRQAAAARAQAIAVQSAAAAAPEIDLVADYKPNKTKAPKGGRK